MAREHQLRLIYQLVGFPLQHWSVLCAPILESFSIEELNTVRKVLFIRQGVLLPIGSIAEEIYRKRDIWTYALFVAVCKKIHQDIIVPDIGLEWLGSDLACTHVLELCESVPSTGALAEIIEKVMVIDAESGIGETGIKLSVKFMGWLSDQIMQASITINEPGALLHVVDAGALVVSPKAFKAFDIENWQVVRSDFEACYGQEVIYRARDNKGVIVRGYIISADSLACSEALLKYEVNTSLEASS